MTKHSDSTAHHGQENSALKRRNTATSVRKNRTGGFPFAIAAPSFVIPANAADNSRFLADHFDEVGILFFETEACLRYTDEDLPAELAHLPISWHVHLPLDLPWERGLDIVWDKLLCLMEKVAFLKPHSFVLHPPGQAGLLKSLATRLRQTGIDPACFLLENVEETDLTACWEEAREAGYSTCLDLGHILAYDQHHVLELDELWETVKMLHVYAPVPGSGKHTGLGHLDATGQGLLRDMLAAFKGETVVLEVFNEKEIFQSLQLIQEWMTQWSEEA